MPAIPAASFHVGLTPERIKEVALQLTQEQHLGCSLHPLVARYPRVAGWLLRHGPTFPAMIPVIDRAE